MPRSTAAAERLTSGRDDLQDVVGLCPIRQLMETFIQGRQPYQSLKKKLFYSVPSVAWDLVSGRQ